MAIPKPKPRDWQLANAQELQVTDREVLRLLRITKKQVDQILADLPEGKSDIRRAQLESSRARLLAEQGKVFVRLGDLVSARREQAASRAARLSAASDAALLSLVGKGPQAQYLYDSALQVGQRAIDAALQRMRYSALPLSKRIYNTQTWMDGRLGNLINQTLAAGLNAREFAKKARDWFDPNTPGGVRYAAMRLARTEINNAFHSISAEKYANTPWITEVEWHLSGSHVTPDECNELAARSPFPSDKTPARPHPQCLCYITPKSIDEDDFIDNFLKGEYDDYLDKELEKNGWQEEDQGPQHPVSEKVDLNKPTPVAAKTRDEILADLKASEERNARLRREALAAKKAAKAQANAEAGIVEEKTDALGRAKAGIRSTVAPELKAAAEVSMDRIHAVVGDRINRVKAVRQARKSVEGLGGGAFAFCREGHVHLAHDLHENRKVLEGLQHGGGQFNSGYMVKGDGDGFHNITAHEMGHALLQHQYLNKAQERELKDVIISALGLPPTDKELYEMVRDNNAYYKIIKPKISAYAARNTDELLAEVWAEYVGNKNAAPYIKTIGDKIAALVKEGKRRGV